MENENNLKEGQLTTAIEDQTAKIPSVVYLSAAIASIGASMIFKLMKKDHHALFVGQWVAPFLLLGIYNKIVKTEGSD